MSWYHSTLFSMDRRPSRLIASCKRFSRRLSTGIFRAVRRIQVPDTRLEAILSKNPQHPRSIDEIMKCTRFSKSEIRLLYRSFKQECPGGNVSEERLREIYLQFFPQGSPIKYAHYLFSVMDRNHKGTFTFDDYILTLSVLCRGTLDEKLRWIFRLYDINGEGQLTRENMSEIILSFYDLLGPSVQPRVDEREIQQHVNEIFDRIDPMQTEQITLEDFIDYCKRRPYLIESIQALSCCL
jgi:Ca2+-binding EF-hand superfamily protein